MDLDGDNDFIDFRLQLPQILDVEEAEDTTCIVERGVTRVESEIRRLVREGSAGSGGDGRARDFFPTTKRHHSASFDVLFTEGRVQVEKCGIIVM